MRIFYLFTLILGSSFAESSDAELLQEAQTIFSKLPTTLIDQEKFRDQIALGKKLYFEKRLSINNTISCNSCHKLDQFGVDNEPTSPGHNGQRGGRNSPTVYNSALNFKQFWDGRAKDLIEQAKGPILNPIEHGLPDEKTAMDKIKNDEYIKLFAKAFPNDKNPFTYHNLATAISSFEKTLLTPSRFDDYLGGDQTALTSQEKSGLNKYLEYGCTSCHSGTGLGGSMYQKLGLLKKYPTKDLGRYEVTKKKRDMYKFKVPTLRNITKTGPYFHDGSIKTLEKAIEIMFEYQLGQKASKEDLADIKAFLASLEAKKLPAISN